MICAGRWSKLLPRGGMSFGPRRREGLVSGEVTMALLWLLCSRYLFPCVGSWPSVKRLELRAFWRKSTRYPKLSRDVCVDGPVSRCAVRSD